MTKSTFDPYVLSVDTPTMRACHRPRVFVGMRKEPEYPEKSHISTGRTCKHDQTGPEQFASNAAVRSGAVAYLRSIMVTTLSRAASLALVSEMTLTHTV